MILRQLNRVGNVSWLVALIDNFWMGGNKGVDINWDAGPVFDPVLIYFEEILSVYVCFSKDYERLKRNYDTEFIKIKNGGTDTK